MNKKNVATVAEMIVYLERFPKDMKVVLNVKDHFSNYGVLAKFQTFDKTRFVWDHKINIFGDLVLSATIDKKQDKSSKIIFRNK